MYGTTDRVDRRTHGKKGKKMTEGVSSRNLLSPFFSRLPAESTAALLNPPLRHLLVYLSRRTALLLPPRTALLRATTTSYGTSAVGADGKKKNKMGMGTGLAVGAAAGVLGGLALAGWSSYLEDKFQECVLKRVEEYMRQRRPLQIRAWRMRHHFDNLRYGLSFPD